jgi:two-component system, response regulator PdtaR
MTRYFDSPTRSGGGTAEPIRILVVEDEYLVAMQMQATLAEAGFTVIGTAATGEDALAIAAQEQPALAIVDIRLGGVLDGVEAALALFRQHGIRSILATANYDEKTQIRAMDASPLGWLPKPFEMRSLVLKVQSAVRSLE